MYPSPSSTLTLLLAPAPLCRDAPIAFLVQWLSPRCAYTIISLSSLGSRILDQNHFYLHWVLSSLPAPRQSRQTKTPHKFTNVIRLVESEVRVLLLWSLTPWIECSFLLLDSDSHGKAVVLRRHVTELPQNQDFGYFCSGSYRKPSAHRNNPHLPSSHQKGYFNPSLILWALTSSLLKVSWLFSLYFINDNAATEEMETGWDWLTPALSKITNK